MTKPDALSRREDHTVGIEDDNKGIVVITPDKIRTTMLITDDGDILKHKIFNATCLLKQPNKPVYHALGNPTRGKVTSQSDCRR